MIGAPRGGAIGAILIFDLEDQFARVRGVPGPHPRPLGSVRFFLVGMAGNAQPFDPPLEMAVTRNSGGYHLFFGEVKRSDGSTRRIDAAQWPWTMRVQSDFYQQVDQTPALPAPASFMSGSPGAIATDLIHFDLFPGPSYPFPKDPPGKGVIRLRGTQRNPDGTGIANVPVQALDPATGAALGNSAVTASDGQWVVTFASLPAGGVVTVRFTKSDGAPDDIAGVQVKADIDNNLPQTALRGQVRRQKAGVAGAAVSVERVPGNAVTDSSGSWFYYFRPDQTAASVTVNVALPDGRTSSQDKVLVQPRATVAVPSFDF